MIAPRWPDWIYPGAEVRHVDGSIGEVHVVTSFVALVEWDHGAVGRYRPEDCGTTIQPAEPTPEVQA